MLSIAQVQDYVRAIGSVETLGEVQSQLDGILQELGFSHYALVHHVNVISPPLGFVKVTNYPDAWKEEFTNYRYYADDPTRVACQVTASPFLWNGLGDIIRMTQRQQAFMKAAQRNGLALGYTVPIHVPGRVSGSVNFASRRTDVPREVLPAAHHIGVFTFEAARRIAENEAVSNIVPIRLTDRQVEVVQLVAQGKSNWVTGQILGIGERTVKEHLQEAMNHYGVSSRTELVVRSLFDGNLSFADVLPNGRPKQG
jgi:LuxR family transcriptional regulator, quorum-sensing system regulator CciR